MALEILIWAAAIIACIVAIPYVLIFLHVVSVVFGVVAVAISELVGSLRKKR